MTRTAQRQLAITSCMINAPAAKDPMAMRMTRNASFLFWSTGSSPRYGRSARLRYGDARAHGRAQVVFRPTNHVPKEIGSPESEERSLPQPSLHHLRSIRRG
jgi:hypothetical protein